MSGRGQKYFKALIKASSHANITVEDIRRIPLSLPLFDEEKTKISNFFQQLDRLISQHQTQIQKLNHLKQAFLSKMFV
jgi:type I restriction enzyme S subunit